MRRDEVGAAAKKNGARCIVPLRETAGESGAYKDGFNAAVVVKMKKAALVGAAFFLDASLRLRLA